MRFYAYLVIASLLLAACAPAGSPSPASTAAGSPAQASPTVSSGEVEATAFSDDGVRINRRVAFEETRPAQRIPLDGIRPIYDPEFTSADEAPLLDDELVLGVAIEDEAKAYPISVLRFREMVNDEMAGIPTLVTW